MELPLSSFGFSGTCSDNPYSESSLDFQRVVLLANALLCFPIRADISHPHQKSQIHTLHLAVV